MTTNDGFFTESSRCTHPKVAPTFDMNRARTMTVHQIREEFPRFFGICPDCQKHVILYASTEHYVMGDW